MWGRAHPQGNVALPLSLYLSPSRLSVSFFPCLAGCSSIASQFMGMTTLIDSLFVCVRMGTCWWTIFQTSPAVVWIIRSFSSHATNIALLLCIRLGRLAASLARGWGWEGGVGWGWGTILHDGCTATVHQQRNSERAAFFSWSETSVNISPTCRIAEVLF